MEIGSDSTVAIVGASLAGLRAAESIRAGGFTGRLVVIGEESEAFYDRPPLSKQFLAGKWDRDRINLQRPEKLDALDLETRLGTKAIGLDVEGRVLDFDDGSSLEFDGLVIATGAWPRTLPGTEGMVGVHSLRTRTDSEGLASALTADYDGRKPRLVVVGAGFIGAEVASTAHGLGAEVTILEALPVPLARALGEEMGAICAGLHLDNGVDLRTGVGVESIHESESVSGDARGLTVTLTDGSSIDGDAVAVGIGVIPATDWLQSSSLSVDNGVVVDDRLFAAPGVVVAGDVARWDSRDLGRHVRVEHWTNASEQGAQAGANLVAGRVHAKPYKPVPYFWSDQYDVKIQMLGHADPGDEVVVVADTGSVDERRFVALYGREGRLRAALGFGRPRQLMAYRHLLEEGASFDEALAVRHA